MFWYRHKKTWTIYFVYASEGIAKHHCTLKRVKAHARTDVSVNTFTLVRFIKLAIYPKQEYKLTLLFQYVFKI